MTRRARTPHAAGYRPDYSHLRVLTDADGGFAGLVSSRRVRRSVTPTDRYVALAFSGSSTRALKRVSGGRTRWPL